MFSLFNSLDSKAWFRPALFTLSAVATLVKSLTPSHTIAAHVADWVLSASLPLAAGSVGAGAAKK